MCRLIAAVLVVLVGCAPRITTRIYGSRYPARMDTAEVHLYSASLPNCPFEEIALISVIPQKTPWPFRAPEGEVFNTLRAQARMLGGHAVVGMKQLLSEKNDGLSGGVQGTVVRYQDPNACTPPGRSESAAR